MVTKPVHVIPNRQFVNGGKLYVLRAARTYHICDTCYRLIDPGDNYYSATWLHSDMVSVNIPYAYHVECVVAEVG